MKNNLFRRFCALGLAAVMCLSLIAFGPQPEADAAPGWGGGPGRPGFDERPRFGGGPGECVYADAPIDAAQALSALVSSYPLPEDEDELFSRRDFNSEYAGAAEIDLSAGVGEGRGWKLAGGQLTINAEGSYLLRGELSGGIYIDCSEEQKVQLALGGVRVDNPRGAALHIASADKVFITTLPESENSLISSGNFSGESDKDVNGAIFARCDISFNGKGSLFVRSAEAHGIVTKDDLKICSGTLTVESAKRALSGKDSVRIAGGEISLVSGGDAIRSEHDKEDKGFFYIKGGVLRIETQSDAVQCSGGCFVRGGELEITTGGGSALAADGDEESRKGFKSESHIDISGGELRLDCADDAFNSKGSVIISGGETVLSAGDDGIHADGSLLISGGRLDIERCSEGLESELVVISGGETKIVSSDDGINAAGGRDGSGFGGGPGGDPFFGSAGCAVSISGGRLYIDCLGDGIDSNGAILISGGETVIDGPVSGMDGIIDCGSQAVINGGSFIGTAAMGMNMNFCAASSQGSFFRGFSRPVAAGERLSILDSEGSELVSLTPGKEYHAVLVSLPGMALGDSFVVTAGSEQVEVLLDESVYAQGIGGVAPPGGFGGGRGAAPPGGFGGMTPPEK